MKPTQQQLIEVSKIHKKDIERDKKIDEATKVVGDRQTAIQILAIFEALDEFDVNYL